MDYSQASRVLDITCYDRETVLLLDVIVRAMYHGGTERIDMQCAHQVLAELKGLPNAWSIAGAVMTHAESYEARHFAVSLVEDVVQTRWHALQADERETLKTFIMNLVSHCQNPTTMQTQLFFVNKVNETLVKIAAHEWPARWPSFVTDLTSTARQNQSTCENTLTIFRILAEDLFDYGSEMTSKKNQTLVQRFAEEFGPVLELCLFVLTQYQADQASVSASLLQATMSCLANFLRWMPETAVFHTGLIELLVYAKDQQVVRIQVLKCFTEIVSIKPTEATTGVVMPLWDQILSMADRLPESTFQYNKEVNSQASQFWEQYYRQMAILFTAFLRLYRGLMERRPDAEGARRLQLSHEFLLRMSRVPNDETFKICLNYWHDLAEDVVLEVVRNAELKGISSSEVFRGDRGVVSSFSSRASEFARTFERLREILVSRMAKPKEVCICYDEDSGTVDKEHLPDTDEISLYEVMRESIVYLTNLNPQHMSDVLNQLLRHIIDGLQQGGHQKQWNPTMLNRVCWSVGSISGSLPTAVERSFLIEVTRSLMWLCGHKKGKENKAIVAAMVLYVFGCYTDFLSQSAGLLETLVTKCFEFMADPFPGVQEMAVNCFLNICTGAGKALTKIQPDGLRTVKPGKSILEWVVASVPELEALLVGQKQVLILYEAVATAIGNYEDDDVKFLALDGLMATAKEKWALCQAHMDSVSSVVDIAKAQSLIARKITMVAVGCPKGTYSLIQTVAEGVLHFHGVFAALINKEAAEKGSDALHYAYVKPLRQCKRDFLKMMEIYIRELGNDASLVSAAESEKIDMAALQFLKVAIEDFHSTVDDNRDPGVLSFVAVLLEFRPRRMDHLIDGLFVLCFNPALKLLTANQHMYPDLRYNLFNTLDVLTRHCMGSLQRQTFENLSLYVDCLIFGFQHEQPTIAAKALHTLSEFHTQLMAGADTHGPTFLQGYCRSYWYRVQNAVIGVATDTMHRAGLTQQSLILHQLFLMVELDFINDETAGLTIPKIQANLVASITASFPNVNPTQAEAFVVGLFNSVGEQTDFSRKVKDFLLQLKEYAGSEADFVADKQEALSLQQEKENQRMANKMSVPGMKTNLVKSVAEDASELE